MRQRRTSPIDDARRRRHDEEKERLKLEFDPHRSHNLDPQANQRQ